MIRPQWSLKTESTIVSKYILVSDSTRIIRASEGLMAVSGNFKLRLVMPILENFKFLDPVPVDTLGLMLSWINDDDVLSLLASFSKISKVPTHILMNIGDYLRYINIPSAIICYNSNVIPRDVSFKYDDVTRYISDDISALSACVIFSGGPLIKFPDYAQSNCSISRYHPLGGILKRSNDEYWIRHPKESFRLIKLWLGLEGNLSVVEAFMVYAPSTFWITFRYECINRDTATYDEIMSSIVNHPNMGNMIRETWKVLFVHLSRILLESGGVKCLLRNSKGFKKRVFLVSLDLPHVTTACGRSHDGKSYAMSIVELRLINGMTCLKDLLTNIIEDYESIYHKHNTLMFWEDYPCVSPSVTAIILMVRLGVICDYNYLKNQIYLLKEMKTLIAIVRVLQTLKKFSLIFSSTSPETSTILDDTVPSPTAEDLRLYSSFVFESHPYSLGPRIPQSDNQYAAVNDEVIMVETLNEGRYDFQIYCQHVFKFQFERLVGLYLRDCDKIMSDGLLTLETYWRRIGKIQDMCPSTNCIQKVVESDGIVNPIISACDRVMVY